MNGKGESGKYVRAAQHDEGYFTKVKEPDLPYYLSIAGRRDGFMPFPRSLVQSEIEPCPGFELWSPISFPMTSTVMLRIESLNLELID